MMMIVMMIMIMIIKNKCRIFVQNVLTLPRNAVTEHILREARTKIMIKIAMCYNKAKQHMTIKDTCYMSKRNCNKRDTLSCYEHMRI